MLWLLNLAYGRAVEASGGGETACLRRLAMSEFSGMKLRYCSRVASLVPQICATNFAVEVGDLGGLQGAEGSSIGIEPDP